MRQGFGFSLASLILSIVCAAVVVFLWWALLGPPSPTHAYGCDDFGYCSPAPAIPALLASIAIFPLALVVLTFTVLALAVRGLRYLPFAIPAGVLTVAQVVLVILHGVFPPK